MTGLRHGVPAAAVLLLVVSCAEPQPAPSGNPMPAPEAPKEETPYKKPVRMNNRGEVSTIDMSEVFTLQQSGSALIFDARPAFFYNLGHLPGAINLPAKGGDCDTAIHRREDEIKAAVASGKTIITYCTSRTCPDARTVARHISGFGYPASIYHGGWDEWSDAGLPTE